MHLLCIPHEGGEDNPFRQHCGLHWFLMFLFFLFFDCFLGLHSLWTVDYAGVMIPRVLIMRIETQLHRLRYLVKIFCFLVDTDLINALRILS